MKFLVFVKQVPDSADIRFDNEKKTIVREGVKNIINPYDRRAISEAIRYRNEKGGEVVVVTMGPPQAREALLEALLMGADRAVHVEDRRMAGSDTLATARVLAKVARKIGFDIVFCGQHSTDSETAQIPPEVGELLGVPCATAVRKIEYGERTIRVHAETDEGTDVIDMPLPAVLSAAERLIKPIKLKDADLSKVPAERIETVRLEDLDLPASNVGVEGSPTWVAAIREEKMSRHPVRVEGADPAGAAARIVDVIRRGTQKPVAPEVPNNAHPGERQFWCLLDRRRGELRPVSLEILHTTASLAAMHGGAVSAVVVGQPLHQHDSVLLNQHGAQQIYSVPPGNNHPDEIVALLCERIAALNPFAFFLPADSSGKYLAPQIAARLGLGLTGDCVGLEIDAAGNLVMLKPAFGGTVIAPILCKSFPQMATIRPGALPAFQPRRTGEAIPLIEWTLTHAVPHRYEIVSRETDAGADAFRLDHAPVVVCVGMGLGQENLPLAFRLAELCDGAVGATRRVVDSGWMQRQYQIGLTGKFVAPDVYIGLGISGRYNHTIGIQKSGCIVAVNSDPNAEIFGMADLGITGDCVAVTKALIHTLESR